MASYTLNPLRICSDLARHRYIITQLIKRDVLLKYRGAYLGVAWAVVHPLLFLLAFGFVVGHIFSFRWPGQSAAAGFVLQIYCGLIIFNLFGEVLARAPAIIRGYPNYVKKVVFPLETLPVMVVGTALAHLLVNLLILMVAATLVTGPAASSLLLPVVLLPAVLLALGAAWLLAAWGVFLRDLAHVMPVAVQILMFLSPVFYPASAVPEALQGLYALNPIAGLIEDARRALLLGQAPDWTRWWILLGLGAGLALAAHGFFLRVKSEFADVL